MNVLITGITGNTGDALYQALKESTVTIIGGVRNPNKYQEKFSDIELRSLDFYDQSTYHSSTLGIDKLFLVRPPEVSNYKLLNEFIDVAVKNRVKHIVFISLMGIEKNPFPPHRKIEKHLKAVDVKYTFLRPSFFMQNLLETHLYDIVKHDDLFIPSGKAKLSFIDTSDIGLAAKTALLNDEHLNKAYTLTGSESLTYYQVSDDLSVVLKRPITYSKPSLYRFKQRMLKRGYKKDFINVMLFLNIMTRLGNAKQVTNDFFKLTKAHPRTMKQFIETNKHKFKK